MAFCYYPCPCGWCGDPVKECTCPPAMVSRYQKRLSGPLLDRIDTRSKASHVEHEKKPNDRLGERQRPSASRWKRCVSVNADTLMALLY